MKNETLGIKRQLLLLFVGFIVFVASVGLINQASLSSDVITRECGFFVSCRSESHYSERERVTEFNLNPFAIVGISFVGTLLIVLSVMAIDNSANTQGKKIIRSLIPWIASMLIAAGFLAIGGSLQDEREFIGARTYEEQACLNQQSRALDMQGPWPEDCPSSPSAEAYWHSLMTDF